MGYSRLTPPAPRGNNTGFLGFGLNNPSYGGVSTTPMATGPTPTPATQASNTIYQTESDYDRYHREKARRQAANRASRSYGVQTARRSNEYPTFNEPAIPGRPDFSVERYTGEKWRPSQDYSSAVVDTSAVIAATDALLKERLGGEMSEAARRFGKLGAMQSGGGLGAGYVGTLGESERGYRRDLSEITERYRIQAAEADAQRKLAAYNAAMGRELSAHEGYEGRRFGDVEMANKYGLGGAQLGTNYDWKKYGAEVGAATREQQDAINQMMLLYGA